MFSRSILSERLHNRRTLVALLLTVVVLKAILLWVVLPLAAKYGFVPGTVATARDLYFFIAQSMVGGYGYQVTPDTAETMMRGPAYVLFLAGIHLLFGENIIFSQIANLLFGLGSICIVFLLTRSLTRSITSSVVAATIVAFHPGILVMETRVNVESFFILLLCIFVFLLSQAFEGRNLRGYFFAGLALGFVTLTRSSPIVIIPLIFLFLLLRNDRSALSARDAIMKTGALAFGAVLVLSPWVVRNYSLTGTPSFSENLLGIVAFQGQYVTRTMTGDGEYQVRIHAAREVQSNIAADHGVKFRRFEKDTFWDIFPTFEDEQLYNKVLLQEVMKNYMEDPLLFVRHCSLNSIRFWFQGATPKITLFGLAVTIPLLVLAVVGGYIGIRQRMPIAPLLLVIITVYAVHIPLISHARYSVPLVPLLAVLAGIALSHARIGGRQTIESPNQVQYNTDCQRIGRKTC